MPVDAARIVYFTFEIFGLLNLPILTYTLLFSSSIKRHPTVPNYTFLWAFSSLASCLLLFSGQLDDPEPSRTLCQAQSALMLAQPAAMSIATLSLVWKVWNLTWSIRTNVTVSKEPLWVTCILLGSPYVVWGVLGGAFAVLQQDSRVHRVTFYCTSDNPTLGIVSGILAAIPLLICLFFQAWTMILAYRRYRKSRCLGRAEVGDVSVPLFIRIMSFVVLIFLALILSILATWMFALSAPDIIASTIGPLMFLIFSSQEDVLVSWRVIRRRAAFTDSEADGTDVHGEHSILEQPRANEPHPSASQVEVTFEHFQASSIFNIPTGSKNVHRLSIRVHPPDFSPMGPKSNDSIGDSKSLRTILSSPSCE